MNIWAKNSKAVVCCGYVFKIIRIRQLTLHKLIVIAGAVKTNTKMCFWEDIMYVYMYMYK